MTELDSRNSGFINVTLEWDKQNNSIAVCVYDTGENKGFTIHPPNDKAWDCFNHPFAEQYQDYILEGVV